MVLNVVVGKLLLREQICWLFNTNKWSQLNDDHIRGWTLQIQVGIPFLFQYLLPFISSCVFLPGLCLPCPWRDDDFVVPPCGVPQICCGSLASGSEMKRTSGGWANFLIVFLNDPQFFSFLSIPKTTHHFQEQEALEEGKRQGGLHQDTFPAWQSNISINDTWFPHIQPHFFLSLGLCSFAHFPP